MTDREYPEFLYRPSRVTMVALFLLVLCGAGLLTFLALFVKPFPVRVVGIQLTAAETRTVLRVLAALSPIAVLGMGVLAIASFTGRCRVTFRVDSITAPKANRLGIPSQEIRVPYDEIVSVKERPFVGKEQILEVIHRSGRVCLFSNMFAKRSDFDKTAEILFAIINARNAS